MKKKINEVKDKFGNSETIYTLQRVSEVNAR